MSYTAIVKVSFKAKLADGTVKKYVVKKPHTFFESVDESLTVEGETETLACINDARKEKFSRTLRARLQAKVTGEDSPESDVEDLSDELDD
jgi:hypothetical protein